MFGCSVVCVGPVAVRWTMWTGGRHQRDADAVQRVGGRVAVVVGHRAPIRMILAGAFRVRRGEGLGDPAVGVAGLLP